MVLAYAASLDTRFNTGDSDQAQARVYAWTDVLSGVPSDFVLDQVRRYYRSHHDWPITPGAIRTAWLTHQRVEESRHRPRALPNSTYPVTDRARELIAQARAEAGITPKAVDQ